MRSVIWPYVLIGALVGGVSFAVWHQHITLTKLRAEVATQHRNTSEHARLLGENRRLLASQPSEEEIEATVGNVALAAEIKAQIAQFEERAKLHASEGATTVSASKIISLEGSAVVVGLWQNAGRETPADTFQTALWAAANGNLDELAASMSFESEAVYQAQLLFSELSPALQRDLGSPERMMALMTALDVPMGRAMIVRNYSDNDVTKLAVQLTDQNGESRRALLSLQLEAGQWKFIVPANAVTRYTEELRASLMAMRK